MQCNKKSVELICAILITVLSLSLSTRSLHYRKSGDEVIPDFRYNSARIDGITKLPNNTLIVISNDYYWVLKEGQLPREYNVGGRVNEFHPKFKIVDAIFTDPYNEYDPKTYIISHVSDANSF